MALVRRSTSFKTAFPDENDPFKLGKCQESEVDDEKHQKQHRRASNRKTSQIGHRHWQKSLDSKGLNDTPHGGVHSERKMPLAETVTTFERKTGIKLPVTITWLISCLWNFVPESLSNITTYYLRDTGSAVDKESYCIQKTEKQQPKLEHGSNVFPWITETFNIEERKDVDSGIKILHKAVEKFQPVNNSNIILKDIIKPKSDKGDDLSKIYVNYHLKNKLKDKKNISQFSIRNTSEKTESQLTQIEFEIEENPIKDVDHLEFRNSSLEKKHLESFSRFIDRVPCKISKLSLDYTKNAGEMIPFCCEIVNKCDTSNLSLEFDRLENEDMKTLSENLKGKSLETLNLSYNNGIGSDGFKHIGHIVRDHGVRTLKAADCDISDESLENLFAAMKGENAITFQLEELDISCSKNLTAVGFGHLGKFVRNKGVKRLKLSGFHLTAKTLGAFYENLKLDTALEESKPEKDDILLDELDVSYNSTMEPDAYTILGSMIKICGVRKLSLAGCGMDEKHLQKLRKETQKHMMESMDAADNSSIGEGIVEIAKIVKESNLEVLDISDCNLVAYELRKFHEELGKAKLKRLHLGDRHNELGEEYIAEVCVLLDSVREELKLSYTILRKRCRNLLQKKKAQLKDSAPEIILGEEEII